MASLVLTSGNPWRGYVKMRPWMLAQVEARNFANFHRRKKKNQHCFYKTLFEQKVNIDTSDIKFEYARRDKRSKFMKKKL